MTTHYPLGRQDSEGDMSEGEYESMYYDTYFNPDGIGPSGKTLDVAEGRWVVRGGQVLKIAEMDAAHIDNAIGLFERAGHGDHPKIRELREERNRRRQT